jgi:hypothetical protein
VCDGSMTMMNHRVLKQFAFFEVNYSRVRTSGIARLADFEGRRGTGGPVCNI